MIKRNLMLITMAIGFMACSGDDNSVDVPMATLTLNLNGLEAVDSGFVYEG